MGRQRLAHGLGALGEEGAGLLPARAAGELASDDDPGGTLRQRSVRPGS
ncbi:hypothetical protein N599_32865 [Saccharopolyspora erythraea D]|nr:hypothetical protein N599_32865 [Saccharopolyspora erythraea D]